LEAALSVDKSLHDPRGEAATLRLTAQLKEKLCYTAGAATNLDTARALQKSLHDGHAEAVMLRELAEMKLRSGDHTGALDQLVRSRALCEEVEDQPGMAQTLLLMGMMRTEKNKQHDPITMGDVYVGLLEGRADILKAGTLFSAVGNTLGQAECARALFVVEYQIRARLAETGDALRDILPVDSVAPAPPSAESGQAFYRNLGEATRLVREGTQKEADGDYAGAAADISSAVPLYRQMGHTDGQVQVLRPPLWHSLALLCLSPSPFLQLELFLSFSLSLSPFALN
jgi:hypothetical protein